MLREHKVHPRECQARDVKTNNRKRSPKDNVKPKGIKSVIIRKEPKEKVQEKGGDKRNVISKSDITVDEHPEGVPLPVKVPIDEIITGHVFCHRRSPTPQVWLQQPQIGSFSHPNQRPLLKTAPQHRSHRHQSRTRGKDTIPSKRHHPDSRVVRDADPGHTTINGTTAPQPRRQTSVTAQCVCTCNNELHQLEHGFIYRQLVESAFCRPQWQVSYARNATTDSESSFHHYEQWMNTNVSDFCLR